MINRELTYNLIEHADTKTIEDRLKNFTDTNLDGIGYDLHIVYEVTDKIKEILSYIEENITKVIKDNATLKEGYFSATIEGARTTIDLAKTEYSKSDKMVMNTYRALNYAYSEEISDKNVRKLWTKIVKDVCENTTVMGKKYRNGMVYVGNHEPERPNFIEKKLNGLNIITNSIINSCVVHFYLAYIHPFCDGNGRFSRIIQSKMLYMLDENFASISISESIYNDLNNYYLTLRNSELICEYEDMKFIDITPFIEYMLTKIKIAVLTNLCEDIKPREQRIYAYLVNTFPNGVTVRQFTQVSGYTESGSRTLLNKLVDKGYLYKEKEKGVFTYKYA
jgi:Fic family protein